ncbi:Ig-like domain-containing protein, partial [Domibacillus sp. PGB-M46]|uniref:OmpL47-type beta-barrel domain-containing protein n=1 Tax=Domibacillus sp. PGB-M46 TaxID=2910255 RepID=UPI001F59EB36
GNEVIITGTRLPDQSTTSFTVNNENEDSVAPEAPTVNEVTDASLSITGSAEKGSIITVRSGTTTLGTATTTIGGDYVVTILKQMAGTKLEITATDAAGNISEAKEVIVSDKTPPLTETLPFEKSWTNKDVTIELKAKDNFSGVEKTEYSYDAVTWTLYNQPISISAEGETKIYFRSIDVAGNMEETRFESVKIDKVAPKTKAISSATSWTNKDVTVKLTAEDNSSEVEKTEYSYDGVVWKPYSQPVTISTEGKTTFHYRSTDAAGNTEEEQLLSVKIDKTAPLLEIMLDKSELWSPNHKMMTINADVIESDSLSGIDKTQLVSIVSSENDVGYNRDDQPFDIQEATYGTLDVSFDLRAERFTKDGRIYTVTYKATDIAGNEAIETAIVTVPHNKNIK